ncbi:hypothetical protein GCM10009416_33430 [Craurococcus roseus]|uniref:Uncharacterized protein n=1 Tax=Craurococcus roseus TaxID=77585 RepID=A0ABP3QNC3_9PROT
MQDAVVPIPAHGVLGLQFLLTKEKTMNGHLVRWVALGAVAGVLGACSPAPRSTTSGAPALRPTGGGTGGAEMDHSRMGGGQGSSTGSPTLRTQGGGTGGGEMDHSRMGGSVGAGGRTPSVSPTGGGTGGAEFAHPGVTGTGRAR